MINTHQEGFTFEVVDYNWNDNSDNELPHIDFDEIHNTNCKTFKSDVFLYLEKLTMSYKNINFYGKCFHVVDGVYIDAEGEKIDKNDEEADLYYTYAYTSLSNIKISYVYIGDIGHRVGTREGPYHPFSGVIPIITPVKKLTYRELEKLSKNSAIYFAIFCAEQVQQLETNKDNKELQIKIITCAKEYLNGKAITEECKRIAWKYFSNFDFTYPDHDRCYYVMNAVISCCIVPIPYEGIATLDSKDWDNEGGYKWAIESFKDDADKQVAIKAQWELYNGLLADETAVEDVLLA